MKFHTKRRANFGIACSALIACLPVIGNAEEAPAPALFRVGAAVVDVTPTTPLYIGGYGKQTLVSESHDPLQVRAFVVAKGDKAVAFVIVDSTGWFAEYQGAEAGLGTLGARTLAAEKLAAHGFDADRSAVMVSTTHVHAAPTLTGIWGTTTATTEGKAYLKRVRDAVAQAVDQAAGQLHTSELWTATGNVRSFVWQNGQGTNHPDGFPVDEQMPVLWARDPATGATNALYVNVPNHPDQFDGADQKQFSADFPGYVRTSSTPRSAASAWSPRARSAGRSRRVPTRRTAKWSARASTSPTRSCSRSRRRARSRTTRSAAPSRS